MEVEVEVAGRSPRSLAELDACLCEVTERGAGRSALLADLELPWLEDLL